MTRYENEFARRMDDIFGENQRPMWVWGVCAAVARRMDVETWIIRAAAVVLLIILTVPTLVTYFVLGVLLPECRERTFRSIRKFAQLLDALVEAAGRRINQWLDRRHTA